MGAEIITTNQTGQYVIDSGDFVALMPDVTLTVEATTDPGFLADHDGACTLTILGQVVSYGTAARIGNTATGTMLATVTLGEDGLLQSLTGFGVEIRRSGSRIDNDGAISGGNAGVVYGAGVSGAEIANTGTISSLLGYGVGVTGAAGGGTPGLFRIVNSGVIEAATDGVSVGHESLALTNHGDIVAFGTGIALADDPGLENTLTLVNTGLVQGDTAAVDATGHADSVTNSGTLLGAVLLGEGDNLISNSGTIAGAVSAGSGADRVTNSGRITGDVSLGDGADSLALEGRIEGSVDMGAGADVVWIGEDATLPGGTLDGGSGDDTLYARIDVEDVFNFETIRLKGGAALGAVGDAADNAIYGNRAGNEIDGGAGDDRLYGRAGGDTLLGGPGADEIKGGRGADDLIGGAGGDILTGGRGRDSFAYEDAADSLKSDPDRILDFDRGRDTIDLSALGEGTATWLGAGRFTGSGEAQVRVKGRRDHVEVKIDADGDGRLDMMILVDDLTALDAGDFLL